MRTCIIKTIWLIVMLYAAIGIGQDAGGGIVITADHYKIKNVKLYYQEDIEKLKSVYDDLIKKEGLNPTRDTVKINDLIKKRNQIVFNPKFLNMFFSGEISSFMTTVKDQTLDQYFLNANSDNKTLTIGRNFDVREFWEKKERIKLEKMSHILTLYASSNLDKGFSSVYSKNDKINEYDLNSDIGMGIRYTYFFNGLINFKPRHAIQINSIRNTIVFPNIDAEINTNIGDNFDVRNKIKDELRILKIIEENNNYNNKKNDFFESKYYEYYIKTIENEIGIVKKEKLFNSYSVIWLSVELYQPFSKKSILSTNDKIIVDTTDYRNWRLEASFNYLKYFSNGISFRLKSTLSRYNTNNFIMKNITPYTFEYIAQENPGNNVVSSSKSVFPGIYDVKPETSLRFEGATLFINNSFGISGTVERNFYFGTTNWKIGMPFSLKDKDNKPTVNFEVLWREINKSHVVGINAVYSFGKFLK